MLHEKQICIQYIDLLDVAKQRDVDVDLLIAVLWGLVIYFRTGDTEPRLELCRSSHCVVETITVHVVEDASIWQLVRNLSMTNAVEGIKHRLVFGKCNFDEPHRHVEVMVNNASNCASELICRWNDDFMDPFEGHALCSIYSRLCAWFSKNLDDTIASIELLNSEEARKAMVCGPKVEFDRLATLHSQMYASAEAHPNRIAIRTAESTMTYAELSARTRVVAQQLRVAGVRRGDRIGIIAQRSLYMPIGLFGILAAGAAYVPLDLKCPTARLHDMIRIARVSMILSSGSIPELDTAITDLSELLPNTGLKLVKVGSSCKPMKSATQLLGDEVMGNWINESKSEDLCYIIFTSGSTGVPKGVMVSHRSVNNRLHWMQGRYPITPEEIVLQKTPAVFDVSVWELFWWSQVGASVYLIPPGHERFPLAIIEAIAKSRATVAHFIPSVIDPFLIYLERHGGQQRILSLRRVFCSGEALSCATVSRFWRIFGVDRIGLTNLYGPTEATVDVTYYDCMPQERPQSRIPIGLPIQNTRLHVLRHGYPVPVGATGTLFVAGECLARGYANAPEQTKAAFVPEIYGKEVMYNTGDQVRWNDEGQLEFLGRCDGQIKISGMRVEPEEIEQIGREHPIVEDCAIAISGYGSNLVRLTAIVVAKEQIAGMQLRDHFASRLPPHMVPIECRLAKTLPRTLSGKIDRLHLADPTYLEDHTTQM